MYKKSIDIEKYNYRGKGQCIKLSTLDNTYFLFSEELEFNVTKIQFATEYYYKLAKKIQLGRNKTLNINKYIL